MGRRLFQIPQPLNGDEEWLLVSFCIPDTPDWRRLIVGWGDTLTYGVAYDEQTGNIKQAQAVGREIFNSMSMCNLKDQLKVQRMLVAALVGENVDLTDDDNLIPDAVDYTETGIGPILAGLKEIEDGKYFDLDDFITALASNPFDTFKDLLEVATFIKELAPDGFKIDVGQMIRDFRTMRYRTAIHDQVMDIALSQRAQALAQGGLDFAGIYDIAGDTVDAALLPTGFLGRVKWLWGQLQWKDIPGWATWLGNISALLLGNIRGALYDINDTIEQKELDFTDLTTSLDDGVVDAINTLSQAIGVEAQAITAAITGIDTAVQGVDVAVQGIDVSGIAPAIEGLEMSVNVNTKCYGCGSTDGCQCEGGSGGAGPTDEPPTDIDDPGDNQGDPPPGFPDWPTYRVYKCNMAQKIYNDMLADIIWTSGFNILSQTVQTAVPIIVIAFVTPIPLDGIIALAATIFFLAVQFASMTGLLTGIQEKEGDIICALYEAENVTSAVSDLVALLHQAVDSRSEYSPAVINSPMKQFVEGFATIANLNRLFDAWAGPLPTGDCSNCGDPPVTPCDYSQSFATDLDGWAIDPTYPNNGAWTLDHSSSNEQLRLTCTDSTTGKRVRVLRMFPEPFDNSQGDGYGFFANWDAGNDMDDVEFSLVDENGVDILEINTSGFGPEQVQQTITNLDQAEVWGLAVRIVRNNGTVNFRLHDITLRCCTHSVPVGLQNEPYGQIVSDNSSTMTIQALEDAEGIYRANVHLRDGCLNHTVSAFSVSGVIDATGISTDLFRLSSPAGGAGDVYSDDAMPPGSYDNVFAVHVLSSQPFSVTFTYQPYDEVP